MLFPASFPSPTSLPKQASSTEGIGVPGHRRNVCRNYRVSWVHACQPEISWKWQWPLLCPGHCPELGVGSQSMPQGCWSLPTNWARPQPLTSKKAESPSPNNARHSRMQGLLWREEGRMCCFRCQGRAPNSAALLTDGPTRILSKEEATTALEFTLSL